ncbi:MAG: N-6 DNA methylase [Candidatus Odinarchaeia archaeon]
MTRKDEKTTPQRLSSLIKSCRDIMRKDKGLSGDLDRIPILTWVMFLKFLDDKERIIENEAKLAGKKFEPIIEPPYRWRDWAAKEEGITGDELISFINNDEAVRPDGSRGEGLFAYLRSLQGADGGDSRDVIATIFRGITNRMTNGYLLKDVVNKINAINFTSSEEIHTLSYLYETMLKELVDAAGDSGEFYTPRPVVQIIVDMIDPQLGEKILDPAAGTGGFLVEAFNHLQEQCNTTKDYKTLQRESIFGGEAKPLPYLLGQMNLLLHGLEYPQIDPGNSLRFRLREIGDKDRVDVIVTNPPFGGEEEKGILNNFPQDKRTAETALLFLQLIMRKLRRKKGSEKGGRCGMVVPNGTLFGDGVAARIKKDLLENFNLHTIVRLPKGVFEPYTGIETNLLFFEKDGPTKEIWYYEHPLPPERMELKNPCYVKSKPLRYEEFDPLKEWWNDREENEYAWKVSVDNIVENNYNLDVKNPNKEKEEDLRTPEEIVASVIEKEERISELMNEIKSEIQKGWEYE